MTPLQLSNLVYAAKKEGKTTRIKVEDKLYLIVGKTGTTSWYCRLKVFGKEHTKTLGAYPDIPMKQALEQRDCFISSFLTVDKSFHSYTVKEAYEDWAKRKKRQVKSFAYMERRILKYIIPKFGKVQLSDLTPLALIKCFEPLEAEGKIETIRKLCVYIKDITLFAQDTGRANVHDFSHLKRNYPPVKSKHLAAFHPNQLSNLFYTLECFPRQYSIVWQAFMTQLYTLSRPTEVAYMKWEWIDFNNRVIIFPAEIMKTGNVHSVPISEQLFTLLSSLPKVCEYVFPSDKLAKRGEPINKESVRLMLTNADLQGKQTAHGIRSIGATWFAEQGYPEDVSEACLAHVTANAVRRAYQRSELLEKRRPIMQAWCDYVDQCRAIAHERIRHEN